MITRTDMQQVRTRNHYMVHCEGEGIDASWKGKNLCSLCDNGIVKTEHFIFTTRRVNKYELFTTDKCGIKK